MDGNDSHDSMDDIDDMVEDSPSDRMRLHRLAAVRREKGICRYELAEKLGLSVEEVRLQEQAANPSVGTLNQWATALNVPVTELVVEPDEWQDSTHLAKAKAERMLRVAATLRDHSRRRSIQRLAQTFVDQLTEILPALNPTKRAQADNRPPNRQMPTPPSRSNGQRQFGKLREPPKR